jgi:hypothetical protein
MSQSDQDASHALLIKSIDRTNLKPADLRPAKVKIKKVEQASHPACGQNGLYVLQKLTSDQFIVDYVGVVSSHPSSTSDYVLNFTQGVSIDAELRGNEARFVNDFRGVASEPNAEFQIYRHPTTQHIRMGLFVKKGRSIRKGEEILVSYGKGFWKCRTAEE